MKALPIYYEAKLVANVSFDSHGFPELEYSESWQRSGFDISVTLPRIQQTHRGPEVRTFFENILPEGLIRRTCRSPYACGQAHSHEWQSLSTPP